jgi:hypothetical protein
MAAIGAAAAALRGEREKKDRERKKLNFYWQKMERRGGKILPENKLHSFLGR